MQRFDLKALRAISQPPVEDRHTWLGDAERSIEFLRDNSRSDEIAIFAMCNAVLIHAVLAPTSQISPPDPDTLLSEFVEMDRGWRIQRSYGGGEGHRVYLEPPLNRPLEGGEKLIFRRRFVGVRQDPVPIELNQKLVHSLDLHFVPERNAYCRLDGRGDIEEVIRVIRLIDWGGDGENIVVTILANDLFKYMALTETALVFRFDFTRLIPGNFGSWKGAARNDVRTSDLSYHSGTVAGHASWANGYMIVRTPITVDALVQDWIEELDPKNREYVTFKIYDPKNDVLKETSCAPDHLSNYFQKSDLPWEISPAFFRADVLHRFKADPEKYDLDDRTIACRGAWYLKTYDINEAGQVHTYIGYLNDLPIEEQRYWQSFNEWPKGSISKRAFQTDILGEFSTELDPLNSIKSKIRSLNDERPDWWKPRGEDIINLARYPATDSALEWSNEILALDQLLIEGFLVRPLKAIAEKFGRTIDSQWASLKVLEECLIGFGRTEEQAKELVKPLRELQALRTTLRGHSAPTKRRAAETAARTSYGTLRAHFTALALSCDTAFEQIIVALRTQ